MRHLRAAERVASAGECIPCPVGGLRSWANAGRSRYRHDVPAPRPRTRTPSTLRAAVRIVPWDTASQSIRILVDSGVFAELRDQLLRRIPVHSPDWTDYNASDPGVTLLELLAYLGEDLLYRFNHLTEPACSRLSTRLPAGPKAALRRGSPATPGRRGVDWRPQ